MTPMKTATANFDCADIYQEHGYLVRLTKGREAKVQVFEVFGRPPTEREAQWAPETILRCEASREVWDVDLARGARRVQSPAQGGGQARRALGRGRDRRAAAVRQGAAGAALGGRAAGREAGGDRRRDPQLAGPEARGTLVALHHDRRGDGACAPSRHGLARRAAAGALLRHAARRVPPWRGQPAVARWRRAPTRVSRPRAKKPKRASARSRRR